MPQRVPGSPAVNALNAVNAPAAHRVGWVHDGTVLAESIVDGLADGEFAGPCGLPGWSRAHLVTHLARNADALVNLTVWARTGTPTPMYPDPARRAADIETGAARPAAAIREDLHAADGRLARAVASMRAADWTAPVRTAQGREVPAAELIWLRTREVWIHAVDLAVEAGFGDLPADLVDALLDDVTGGLARREGCPAATLAPGDRDRTWLLRRAGAAGTGGPVVSGPAAQVLRWLTGRGVDGSVHTSPDGGPPPALPAWL